MHQFDNAGSEDFGTIQTTRGDMTVGQALSALLYISYASNRDRSPQITPERWAHFYPHADVLEARYQAAKAISKARFNGHDDD